MAGIVLIVIALVVYYLYRRSSVGAKSWCGGGGGGGKESGVRKFDVGPFDPEKHVKDEYIVMMAPSVGQEEWARHMRELNDLLAGGGEGGAREPFYNGNGIINSWYVPPDFKAYHFRSDQEPSSARWANHLKHDPRVKSVERNALRKPLGSRPCDVEQLASWQLQRIQVRNPEDMDGMYSWDYDGKDVDAYVIDTGINPDHKEFGDRAVVGPNFSGDGLDVDGNGHGTHVAAIVGGRQVGVARGVTLIGVKVLNSRGQGTTDSVLSGINWVAKSARERSARRAVANMSLGGPRSSAENAACAALVDAGVVVAVAAGNENADACYTSPASEPKVITVGASTRGDVRASFSNWGKCLDIFAPGVDVKSADHRDKEGYKVFSGTSQATPFVAGASALLLQQFPDKSPAEIKAMLIESSTKNALDLNCDWCCDTPNRLLYVKPCSGMQ